MPQYDGCFGNEDFHFERDDERAAAEARRDEYLEDRDGNGIDRFDAAGVDDEQVSG